MDGENVEENIADRLVVVNDGVMPKTHFGRFEMFVKKIPYYHSPETSIADISKTVDRRAKRSSISTLRAISIALIAILRWFEKSKMAAKAETSIAIISETVDRRAKRSN